jgi:hypothetical protein
MAVRHNPDRPWTKKGLSMNKGITIVIIDRLSRLNIAGFWSWSSISENIAIEEVWHHPLYPWDREGLSTNEGITMNLVNNLKMPHAIHEWDWEHIQANIPMHDFYRNPKKHWNKRSLSTNPNLTIIDIRAIDPSIGRMANPYRINMSISLSDISIIL